jgi:hypothetical protein
LITEGTVQGKDPARYYSRGQKHIFHQEMEDEDRPVVPVLGESKIEEIESDTEEEGMRATG